MGRWILGLSAFYHDSAAALLHDGEIVAAAQEERFSRKKHDPRFPKGAINYCLEEAMLEARDLDAVVFYDNPILTWDRAVKNFLMMGESAFGQFEKAAPSILGVKIFIEDYVRRFLGTLGKSEKLLFSEHHFAHAASAFFPSPYERAAVVTLDGVGEWATTSIGLGDGRDLQLFREIHYPHSLGLLYSAFTYFCGFKVNSGEYKLMGLAPYGEPKYYDRIRQHLIDLREDGSYRLNTEYFGFLDGQRMTNARFDALFEGTPRSPESRITRREMDLAASVQKVIEEAVLKIARFARVETGSDNLVLAGGVALNCVANGKLIQENIFKNVWIQPASGDAGGALGAALHVAHGYFEMPRRILKPDAQKGSLLGPQYTAAEIFAFLDRHDLPHEKIGDAKLRAEKVAKAISEGKIVGFFSGRMEFGPRALGARSILGDPRNPETQSVMNLKIKFRESFRPFAPLVIEEDLQKYFELDCQSPYMLLVAPVKKARCLPKPNTEASTHDEDLLKMVNVPRSDIPAVTHVDYSARIQTVGPEVHPFLYEVLLAFRALTGCSVLVNTSYNVRGEPMVCSPQDAYRCFMRSEIDCLMLEDFFLEKSKQPKFEDSEDWKTHYELD